MAAWTQADLDALDRALADGGMVKSLTFADQTYEFRDLAEMLKLRAAMVQALMVDAGTSTSYRLAATSKGV